MHEHGAPFGELSSGTRQSGYPIPEHEPANPSVAVPIAMSIPVYPVAAIRELERAATG